MGYLKYAAISANLGTPMAHSAEPPTTCAPAQRNHAFTVVLGLAALPPPASLHAARPALESGEPLRAANARHFQGC
jgi:hypothetical protein